MATATAMQSGNWSDGTTWQSGVFPTLGSDVDLGGFTVTVDVTIPELNSISNGTLTASTPQIVHIAYTINLTFDANVMNVGRSLVTSVAGRVGDISLVVADVTGLSSILASKVTNPLGENLDAGGMAIVNVASISDDQGGFRLSDDGTLTVSDIPVEGLSGSTFSVQGGNVSALSITANNGGGFFGDGSALTGYALGLIAGNAGYADFATDADFAVTATSAGYATNAGTATNAGYATNAGTANYTSWGAYATNAGYASYAGTATNLNGGVTTYNDEIDAGQVNVSGGISVGNGVIGAYSDGSLFAKSIDLTTGGYLYKGFIRCDAVQLGETDPDIESNTSVSEGNLYYDETNDVFRVKTKAGWKTVSVS